MLQRPERVGVGRRPRGPVDPAGERVGVGRRHAREGQHLAVARIEDDGRPVEPGPLEAVFERFLNVFVDSQLEALAFRCGIFLERPEFTSDTVDDDNLRAVLAHQQVVVDLLDARLADHVAALERVAGRDWRIVHLADVAEKRAAIVSWYCRVGTCSITTSGASRRAHWRHLLQRGVSAMIGDRSVGRLARCRSTIRARRALRTPAAMREAGRSVEILCVLAKNRDAVRVTVLDEHGAVAIEDHAARRPQRERTLIVVFGELGVRVVLGDLKHPEAHGQDREQQRDEDLQDAQSNPDVSPIFT